MQDIEMRDGVEVYVRKCYVRSKRESFLSSTPLPLVQTLQLPSYPNRCLTHKTDRTQQRAKQKPGDDVYVEDRKTKSKLYGWQMRDNYDERRALPSPQLSSRNLVIGFWLLFSTTKRQPPYRRLIIALRWRTACSWTAEAQRVSTLSGFFSACFVNCGY